MTGAASREGIADFLGPHASLCAGWPLYFLASDRVELGFLAVDAFLV